MKSLLVLSFLVASIYTAPFTRDMLTYDEDGVIVVNGSNVESVIELHKGNVLIELYASWWYVITFRNLKQT